MTDQEPLFEVIDTATYEAAQRPSYSRGGSRRSKKEISLDTRSYTVWYSLQHTMGYCTVPTHDEVIRALDATKQEYRQQYPIRMVYPIGDLMVCRDCFLIGADRD